jgi:hypothetical protein
MVIKSQRTIDEFSSNMLLMDGIPLDPDADQAASFSYVAGALAITGKNTAVIIQGAAPTGGDANSALFGAGCTLDTGVVITQPFTIAMLMKFTNPNGGVQFFNTSAGAAAYGWVDTAFDQLTMAINGVGGFPSTGIPVNTWVLGIFDVDATGKATCYYGLNGTLIQSAQVQGPAFTSPNTTLSFVQGAGLHLSIAQWCLYLGGNRPTLQNLQSLYKRLFTWYNGNGTGVPLLPNTI